MWQDNIVSVKKLQDIVYELKTMHLNIQGVLDDVSTTGKLENTSDTKKIKWGTFFNCVCL